MALKPCAECRELIAATAEQCPRCGHRSEPSFHRKFVRARDALMLGFLGVCLVLMVLAQAGPGPGN